MTGRLSVRMAKALLKALKRVAGYTRVVNGHSVYVPPHDRNVANLQPKVTTKIKQGVPHTPEELHKKFGKPVDTFEVSTPDNERHFVRKYGTGNRNAYTMHNMAGEHVATIHAKTNKDNLHITNGHGKSDAVESLVRRFARQHSAVYSPAVMHHTLQTAFVHMRDDHDLSTHNSDTGAVRYKASKPAPTLF